MTRKTVRQKKGAPPRRRDNTPLLIAGGVAAILLVAIVVSISVAGSGSPPGAVTSVPGTGRTWGSNPNAKVTIDEWSDFQ